MFSAAFRLTLSWIFGDQYNSRKKYPKIKNIRWRSSPLPTIVALSWDLAFVDLNFCSFFYFLSLTRGSRCGHGHVILLTCRTLTYPFFTSLDKLTGPSGCPVILFLFSVSICQDLCWLCVCVCIMGITMALAKGNANNNNDQRQSGFHEGNLLFFCDLIFLFCGSISVPSRK